ncbi:MAG TPA: NUDIX hydrolase [Gemmatales bacterium]|nr:NUDIX hydrolase [Gemmatales bacterium]
MKQHGPWTIHSSTWVYQDQWMQVQRDEVVRPDGQPGTYAVVHIKPGVCVLAMDRERKVYLTKEFHYAVGETTIECVSGGRDDDESSLTAARRELREELGIEAENWLDLGRLDPFTASVLSPTQLYLAQELRWVDAAPEGTELIQQVIFSLDDAVEMVMKSQITHAPSMALILKAARLLEVKVS